MTDRPRREIIEQSPIGKGLDTFHASFNSVCDGQSIPSTPDSLDKLGHDELQNLSINLLSALQMLPAARLLRSGRGSTFFTELPKLYSTIASDDFDFSRIRPLLNTVLANKSDSEIWNQVYNAVAESTPPPRPIASSLQQTPWLRNTSSFANSSEHRKYVDDVLKEELGPMYVGLRDFHETYFGDVVDLMTASEAVLRKCMEGSNPLFNNKGWDGWPEDANQDRVLAWFAKLSEQLAEFAEDYRPNRTPRRPLAQPNKPVEGSTAERKLDIGLVSNPKAEKDSRCHWSQILVPGELKSNPAADTASKAWLDLGRYAREVLAAQDTRRFVLGFTLCGSLMRIWVFDRLGGIASERFDINKNGLQFVSTVLGFLWMNDEQLGFDPTIITADGERFIEIERDGRTERLIIDYLMKRAHCIAGRATTCWKAHRVDDPQIPLVIKDSWQYTERGEEGELLQNIADKRVVSVARYYYHETVQVLGADDDVQSNVRKGLDITKAENYRPKGLMMPNKSPVGIRKGRSSTTGQKRSSSETGAPLPPSKRSCSASPTKAANVTLPNRVHRRVILCDYGKPIYRATSRTALLAALEACISGHESLWEAGILHRDVSINNLMINEEEDNPSWPSFLIDLDLAIEVRREGVSGAKGKTGTRAFMAIGALLGEHHSFMHDLESFFWVLFWLCVHYEGPDECRVIANFDRWNYVDTDELAKLKKGEISDEGDFIKTAEEYFTSYYQPLIPWVNRLRKVVFPNGRRWEKEDTGLYLWIKQILREARRDSKVSANE